MGQVLGWHLAGILGAWTGFADMATAHIAVGLFLLRHKQRNIYKDFGGGCPEFVSGSRFGAENLQKSERVVDSNAMGTLMKLQCFSEELFAVTMAMVQRGI